MNVTRRYYWQSYFIKYPVLLSLFSGQFQITDNVPFSVAKYSQACWRKGKNKHGNPWRNAPTVQFLDLFQQNTYSANTYVLKCKKSFISIYDMQIYCFWNILQNKYTQEGDVICLCYIEKQYNIMSQKLTWQCIKLQDCALPDFSLMLCAK